MIVKASPMTVADYCAALGRNEIVVNKAYQRSEKVWPNQARSFLIETICADFPLPKFILNQTVDTHTKVAVKEIVDGQQRTFAIQDFFNNRLRLSRTLDAPLGGVIYDDLDEDLQTTFLSYSLDIDLFTGATFSQVIEAFRRLNSFTFPLNPAEKRHAKYQRGIKWTINSFCRKYEMYFRRAGVFTDKSIIRMKDTDLVAEIWDALERGIRTTKPSDLDLLYRRHDIDGFDDRKTTDLVSGAFNVLQVWTDLDKTSLTRPHMLYSLVLAMIHVQHKVPLLEPLFKSPRLRTFDEKRCFRNFTTLESAYDSKEGTGAQGEFVLASLTKTNVAEQRVKRFKTFCETLTREI